ncbi:maternal protein tudor isoform X2 [Condylostylus longicornis]|uniref:maternal protein tudor isoform X2 n=1 Tax=Condylostylus longicornis TaxID=2530218 RepID=UPI00244E36B3|nr:maternal protein tudor isoform X2 [Condylostylus longicornis]
MQTTRIHITCVTTIGGYLRIYGQQNIENVTIIQKNIDCLVRAPMIQTSIPIMEVAQIGNFCLALKGDRFVRARIVSKFPSTGRVNVHYMDYGFDNILDITNIRMSKFPKELELMPVQSLPFILSGIKNSWEPYQIQEINDELLYQTVDFTVEGRIGDEIFIQIRWKNKSLNHFILERKGYGELVTFEYIKKDFALNTRVAKNPINTYIKGLSKNIRPARQPHYRNGYDGMKPGIVDIPLFRSMVQGPPIRAHFIRPQIPSQPYQKTGIPTFKITTLLVGTTYEVVISNVQNGPCSFSVQLHENQKDLFKMMNEISSYQLRRLSEPAKIGMACIARCPRIGLQYYRAVIMNVDLTSCKILFVDFGNTENIPFCDLFDVPIPLLDIKCFSFRFALSGYKELEPVNESLKELFKKNVLNKVLKLKVTPLEGPPLVQYCELYYENRNIFNILKDFQNRKITYTKPEALEQDEIVNVCYIDSPKSFYVHKKTKQNAFEKMMDELDFYCNKYSCVPKKLIKGTPCAFKYENAWYRAEIIKAENNDRVYIRQVDFGVERHTKISTLNYIDERFTSFPQHAIQCCLKGFEDNSSSSISDSVINQFEMLAEESDGGRRNFKVKIFKMLTSHYYLLNLVDESLQPELNLMKRLFKLNLPFNKYIGMEKELNANSTPVTSTATTSPKNNNNKQTQNQSLPTKVQNNNFLSPKQTEIPVINVETITPTSINYNQGNSDKNSNSGSSSRSSSTRGFRRGQRKNAPTQKDTTRNSSRDSAITSSRPGRGGRGRNLPPRFQNQRNNDRRYNGGNDSSGKFAYSNSSEDWSKRTSTPTQKHKYDSSDSEFEGSTEEFLPFNFELKSADIPIPSIQEVVICWWISPHQFFTHDSKMTSRFEKMMRKMQTFYKNRSAIQNKQIEVGSIVIAKYKQDNVLYRAKVLACNPQMKKYKVEFIDFGNRSIVEENDMWQMEKRFAQVPVMANLCSFENIVSNYENQKIIDFIAKYLKQGITLNCQYMKKENNTYFVNINLKDDSLKHILIKEGMVSELKEGTKLHILAGQQIKAKVSSVADLSNFRILIEGCDIDLMCSYHNIKLIKSNPGLSSKFKDKYEGKYCFFDIISVTQDKILMVDPAENDLTENAQPIIYDYPVMSDKLDVKISYVRTPNRLYAQTISNEEKANELLNEMYDYYITKGDILKCISKGMICAANSEDGNWYRAQISSIKPNVGVGVEASNNNDSIFEVYYIDYGNNETIDNISKLKRLEERFSISSAFAMEIYLPFKSIKSMDQESVIKQIRDLVGNYQLELKILESYEGCWIVDILSSDYSLMNVLEEKGLIEKKYDIDCVKSLILSDFENELLKSNDNIEEISVDKPKIASKEHKEKLKIETKDEDEMIDEPPSDIPMQTTVEPSIKLPNMYAAYISHFENPGKFYLQLDADSKELEKMQGNLQIVAEQLPLLKTISKDEKCVARYSVDGIWYRAKVFDNELIAVQFIDYGNIDVVEVSDIKQMVEPFTTIKSFGIPCSLAVAPKCGSDWPEEANRLFNENRDKKVHFNYILESEKKNYVNLFIDNSNVAKTLCSKELVKRLEIVESGESCFISHINGLADFYIQMESYSDGLEAIASYLTGYSQFPLIPSNNASSENIIGTICAAIFPDDNEWYRAKILSETDSGFEVLFIDFGNTAITTEARVISDDIANAPYLSKRCCLRMPNNILEWSQKAEEKFVELAAGGETVFVVDLKKPGEAAVVDLTMGDTNLLDILQPLCEENVNVKSKTPGNDVLSLSIMTMSTLSDSGVIGHEKESVVISHVNSPIDFYVQLNSEVNELEMVTDKLFDVNEPVLDPKVGEIYAALYPKDENYYRAKILSKENDGYNVLYIDFGNCSITNDFKVLPEELKQVTNLAKHVSLAGVGFDLSADNVIEKFNEILEPFFTENVDMIILDKKIDPWIIKLNLNGEDICDRLKIGLGFDMMNKSDLFLQPEINEKRKNVIISHIISLNEFYIQLEDEVNEVENITNKLQNCNEMKLVSDLPEIKKIYAGLFPEDNSYYRAKVISADATGAEVFFIDFGNSAKTTDLRILPDNLKNIRNMATKCCLILDDVGTDYDKFNKLFLSYMDSHFGEIFQIEIMNQTDKEDEWKIKLYNKNSNIYNELLKMYKSKSCENMANVNSFKSCTVSHINNPNDFYVQICDNDAKLNEIAEKLLAADHFNKLVDPKIGDICAAKFPDDGAYYRAKILLLGAENGAKVIYMDFGNEAFTDDLRELPENLQKIEALAKRCALENLGDIDFWSKEAQDCFSEIINEHFNETFQVNIIKDNDSECTSLENFSNEIDPAVVQLEYQSTDIAGKLVSTIKEKFNLISNKISNTSNWDETTISSKNIDSGIKTDSDGKSVESGSENKFKVGTKNESPNITKGIVEEIIDKSMIINEVMQDINTNPSNVVKDIVNDIINSCPSGKTSNVVNDIVNDIIDSCQVETENKNA